MTDPESYNYLVCPTQLSSSVSTFGTQWLIFTRYNFHLITTAFTLLQFSTRSVSLSYTRHIRGTDDAWMVAMMSSESHTAVAMVVSISLSKRQRLNSYDSRKVWTRRMTIFSTHVFLIMLVISISTQFYIVRLK